ncbi:MAG: hypothetical protein U0790_18800 [Isosphaeraceae bacterium]
MAIETTGPPRASERRPQRIPTWFKVAYTGFVAVLVPYYWVNYSPWNFLYFCDVALLLGAVALWAESPLLASLPAVGIVLPQLLWAFDFLTGSRITGMTAYMFDPGRPILVRGLSLFHGWLPFVLAWMVWRLGYDRRAFAGWTIVSGVVLPASFFLAPAPPPPLEHPGYAVNINYVHGLDDQAAQTIMAPLLWLGIMLVGFPLVFYLPAHLVFSKWFPARVTAPEAEGDLADGTTPDRRARAARPADPPRGGGSP